MAHPPHSQTTVPYRPDIDGLRALAVLAVVAFHAFPTALGGGYIGVDVFFVISGYLISGIIFKHIAMGSFSYRDFYARRIRRLFPALITVLIPTIIMGWLVLFPDELVLLGKHIYKGGIFIVNLTFAREKGYFETQSELKPLLHLWSLSIEEQFYIVWPPFLFLLHRYAKKWALHLIIAFTAVSFFLNVAFVQLDPVKNFFLPFTRFWELSCGCILAWIHLNKTQSSGARSADIFSIFGFAFIFITSLFIDNTTLFPGWVALFPVIGAMLIIHAGSQGLVNRTLLSHPIAVFIGVISYPLYLWHWPILSFARIIGGDALSPVILGGLVTLAFVLAWATYGLIEKNMRHSHNPRVLYGLVLCMVMLVGTGYAMRNGYIAARLDTPENKKIFAAVGDWGYPGASNFNKKAGFKSFTLRGNTGKSVLVIGDSHAEQYWPRLEYAWKALSGSKPNLVFMTYGGCPPLPDMNRIKPGYACNRFYKATLKRAAEPDVQTIAYAAFWTSAVTLTGKKLGLGSIPTHRIGDRKKSVVTAGDANHIAIMDQFAHDLTKLNRNGKKIFIVMPSPASLGNNPKIMVDRISGGAIKTDTDRAEYESIIKPVTVELRRVAAQSGARILNPLDALCDTSSCPTITRDGHPMYKDTTHIRPFYIRENGKFLDVILK